jgi:hypothetical protein
MTRGRGHGTGQKTQDIGVRTQDTGHRGRGHWAQEIGRRVQDT